MATKAQMDRLANEIRSSIVSGCRVFVQTTYSGGPWIVVVEDAANERRFIFTTVEDCWRLVLAAYLKRQ